MTNVRVDFDALREFNGTLARVISGRLNTPESGTHEINPDELRPETRKALFAFFAAQLRKAAEEHNAAFSIDTNEAANRQKIADGKAALTRLNEQIAQGLLNSPENAAAIQDWVKANVNGYWSRVAVDLAVQNLGPRGTNVLKWKTRAVAAPQPVAVPEPESVRTLPNGEPELPLDAGEATMRRASKTQLQDLSRRRGEGQNLRKRDGWTGASL